MNPTTTLEQIMETLTKKGFSFQVTKKDIERAVIEHRGIDKRTIERWIELLKIFNFIEQVGHEVYQINETKLNIVSILRKQPQTHIG